MTEAGYPNGFEVGMDCSNDRWVNDEAICTAAVSMLARIGIRARLRTQPFSQFIRLLSPPYETSLFYIGWGTSTYDAHNNLLSLLSTRGPAGAACSTSAATPTRASTRSPARSRPSSTASDATC